MITAHLSKFMVRPLKQSHACFTLWVTAARNAEYCRHTMARKISKREGTIVRIGLHIGRKEKIEQVEEF